MPAAKIVADFSPLSKTFPVAEIPFSLPSPTFPLGRHTKSLHPVIMISKGGGGDGDSSTLLLTAIPMHEMGEQLGRREQGESRDIHPIQA